ncbi:MAG TPA: SufD family Fe-S cluster assembly protein [Candidatus Azoamicus sp. OHIO2]
MDNTQYLYTLLLNRHNFYYSYLRIFLIFSSEKTEFNNLIKLNLHKLHLNNIELNDQINIDNIDTYITIKKVMPKIFLLNGIYITSNNINKHITIKLITEKTGLKDFFEYNLHNNLNLFYITNIVLFNKTIQILFNKRLNKNKKVYIINIITKNHEFIATKKHVIFNNETNNNIFDIYIAETPNAILNTALFLKINDKCNINYNILSMNSGIFEHTFNIISKQKSNCNLYFSDFHTDSTNIIVFYNFFLVGQRSIFKKTSFKNSKNTYTDKRICNIYHYAPESKSTTLFGALVDKNGKIIFEGNIIVGKDIKNVDAHLKCEGLLLATNINLEFNPNMFINNNDITCTHGVSIGNINVNIINYMRSRGIYDSLCKKIFLTAFVKKYLCEKDPNFMSLYKKNLKIKSHYE